MRLISSCIIAIAMLSLAGETTSAFAQTAPDSYTLKTYAPGAALPMSTFTFQATAVVTNQAPPVGASTINPTRVVWDDVIAGRVTIWTDPGTGPLFSLALGNYESTLTAVNAAAGLSSAESARVPFSKQGVPATPTGLHLYR
jgi:hypothetical protein